ncbi:MAG: cyclic peptide export ABC transporter [Methylococcaceae bacterium]|nr:cyclic peptide export ABC transporter [Methylococcaceae bacterium]
MKLLNFINKESRIAKHRIIVMSIVSGLANALLIALINHAAETDFGGGVQARLFFMYLVAFCLFLYTQKFVLSQSMLAIEEALRTVRVRIADKLRHTEFSFIEQSNRNDLYSRLTQDSSLISQSILLLSSAGQAAILIVASLLYILWLSPLSFVLTIGITGTTTLIYFSHREKTRQHLQQARHKENTFFDTLNHLLDGFKELKLNRAKRDDLFADISKTSLEAEQIKVEVGNLEVTDWIMARLCFYTLLPLLVFVIPAIQGEQSDQIYKINAAILFIMGPMSLLIGAIPALNRVNIALDNFQTLEQDVDKATHRTGDKPASAWQSFSQLAFKELSFAYYDAEQRPQFSCGPISLNLKQGELLFIVGGNGSGKSTLLKLITGLYYPVSGAIYRDKDLVDDSNYASYRELFSTIFTDFHLFNRLYGLANVDENKISYWLKRMQLDEKTSYSPEGYFTNTNLSTGQKKRLAFIAAILEDKPILIFDELAADQDPDFRAYFYETILPELTQQGKTVIAVTHDDPYFHCADRVLKMDNGLLGLYHAN